MVNKPWDQRAILSGTTLKPLRIGLMLSDGVITPHPSVLRSLKETARALEEAGHTVIPWAPVDHKGMSELIAISFFQDNAERARDLIQKSGEELTPLAKFPFCGLQRKPITVPESWDVSNLILPYYDLSKSWTY